jgi:hypothetical protein
MYLFGLKPYNGERKTLSFVRVTFVVGFSYDTCIKLVSELFTTMVVHK